MAKRKEKEYTTNAQLEHGVVLAYNVFGLCVRWKKLKQIEYNYPITLTLRVICSKCVNNPDYNIAKIRSLIAFSATILGIALD